MKRAPVLFLFALVLLLAGGGVWFLTQEGNDGPLGLESEGLGFESLEPGQSGAQVTLAGADEGNASAGVAREAQAQSAAPTRRSFQGVWKPPVNAVWIDGRVESENGLPLDEKMFVLAEGRRFSSEPDSPDTYRAEVESDGTFRAAFSPETRRGRLMVEGRYAYAKKPEVVNLGKREEDEEVVINVELGGRIQVEVLPPKAASFSQDALDGIAVEARVGQWTQVPVLDGVKVDHATFELGGAYPDQTYQVTASSPVFADGTVRDVRAKAGEVTRIQVPLTRGARIAGTVRDERGEPLLRGKVMAMSHEEARSRNPFFNRQVNETENIEGGRFEIIGVRPGESMLVVEAEGFLEFKQDLGELFDGDDRGAVALVVSRGGIVSGTVRWPDGEPAQGAEVRIAQADGMGSFDFERIHDNVTLGADGAFEFSGLKEGECAVTAVCIERGWEIPEDASLAERKFGTKAPTWRVHEERISPGRTNLNLELEPGSTVSGVVVDDAGEPVEEFRVTARPSDVGFLSSNGVRSVKERFENDKGKFQIEGLMAGKWTFTARSIGYGTGNEREIRAPFDGEVRLTLPRAGTLTGVVRTPDSESADGARVIIKHGDGRELGVNAGKEGEFKAGKVDPGPVTLVASMDGYAKSLPLELDVGADGKREDLVLELQLGARIVGEIHESIGSMEGRVVKLSGKMNDREETDDDGRFEFSGLEPGSYEVVLAPDTSGVERRARWMFEQANQEKVSLELTPGQQVELVLGKPPIGSVRLTGRVLDEGGAVSKASVFAYPAGDQSASEPVGACQSDVDGNYNMLLQKPGEYRFDVGRQIGKLSTSALRVPAVAEYEHDFELPEGKLAGKIMGPEGTGLGDVYLTLSPAGGGPSDRPWMRSQQTRSLVGGNFVFEDLGAGEYDLRATMFQGRRDLANVLVEGVVVEENATPELRIEMPLEGTVEGGVVDTAGNPVDEATIWVVTEGGKRISEFGRNRSRDDGSFRQGSIAPGDAWLRAEGKAGEGASVKVRVTEGGVTQATLIVPMK